MEGILNIVVVHFNGNGSHTAIVFVQGFRKHDPNFPTGQILWCMDRFFGGQIPPAHGPDVQAFYADGVQIRFDFLQNEAVQEVLRF